MKSRLPQLSYQDGTIILRRSNYLPAVSLETHRGRKLNRRKSRVNLPVESSCIGTAIAPWPQKWVLACNMPGLTPFRNPELHDLCSLFSFAKPNDKRTRQNWDKLTFYHYQGSKQRHGALHCQLRRNHPGVGATSKIPSISKPSITISDIDLTDRAGSASAFWVSSWCTTFFSTHWPSIRAPCSCEHRAFLSFKST